MAVIIYVLIQVEVLEAIVSKCKMEVCGYTVVLIHTNEVASTDNQFKVNNLSGTLTL